MPLGYLMSVKEEWRADMAVSMRDDYDNSQMFVELFDMQEDDGEAIDCGRGYMFLQSYLLEDDTLDSVLIGEEFVVSYDEGATITLNSASIVTEISQKLDVVGYEKLEAMAKSYHEQVPHPKSIAPAQKVGFFARLFGKTDEPILTESTQIIDPSLVSLFDKIKAFYSKAAKDNRAVFYMVEL